MINNYIKTKQWWFGLLCVGYVKSGKVVIKSTFIRMVLVKYDALADIKIKFDLIKESQKINCTVGKPVSGSNFEIDLANSGSLMPDWAIVLFQTDENNKKNKQIIQLVLIIIKLKCPYWKRCGKVFPTPQRNLKINKKEYVKMYYAYTEISRIMTDCEKSIL